ncbi:MAG: hypothetical protein ACOC10_09470 [Bacteroidota bacterium]
MLKTNNINSLRWSDKARDFDKKTFVAKINGYVASGKIEKPSEDDINDAYYKLTGKKPVEKKEVKKNKKED